jgi:glycine/serine hydroxymethyltransferase
MKEEEMLRIAELLKRAIVDNEQPDSIKKDVAKLSAEFQNVQYCFTE